MKKILAIAVVAVMAIALCVSASAQLNIDRIFVDHNEMAGGEDVKDGAQIEIAVGQKLYTLGWAANPEGNLKEIVWSVDGGADQKCPDNYRDRSDVASAGIAVANNGEHAGFGHDNASEGGFLELSGIENLKDGTYTLTIKAVYESGDPDTKDFTLVVGTGESSGSSEQPTSGAVDTPLYTGGVTTGWWMHPFTEKDWEINATFNTPNAFDGFHFTFYANEDPGADVVINLLKGEEVVETKNFTAVSNGEADITFDKAYAAGEYTIQFKSTANGAHFVLGSAAASDVAVEISGNGNTNGDTLAAPAITLHGATVGGAEQPSGQPSNPQTADAAVIAIAAVACIALAGVVIAKKVR